MRWRFGLGDFFYIFINTSMNTSYPYIELHARYNLKCSSKLIDAFHIKTLIYRLERILPMFENYTIYKDELNELKKKDKPRYVYSRYRINVLLGYNVHHGVDISDDTIITPIDDNLSNYDNIEKYMIIYIDTLRKLIDTHRTMLHEILINDDIEYNTEYDYHELKYHDIRDYDDITRYNNTIQDCRIMLDSYMNEAFDIKETSYYNTYVKYIKDVYFIKQYHSSESIYVKTEIYNSNDFNINDYIMNKYNSYTLDIINQEMIQELEKQEGVKLCKHITYQMIEEAEGYVPDDAKYRDDEEDEESKNQRITKQLISSFKSISDTKSKLLAINELILSLAI